jgi:hypothetical protein
MFHGRQVCLGRYDGLRSPLRRVHQSAPRWTKLACSLVPVRQHSQTVGAAAFLPRYCARCVMDTRISLCRVLTYVCTDCTDRDLRSSLHCPPPSQCCSMHHDVSLRAGVCCCCCLFCSFWLVYRSQGWHWRGRVGGCPRGCWRRRCLPLAAPPKARRIFGSRPSLEFWQLSGFHVLFSFQGLFCCWQRPVWAERCCDKNVSVEKRPMFTTASGSCSSLLNTQCAALLRIMDHAQKARSDSGHWNVLLSLFAQ